MTEREARFAASERFRDSLPEHDPDEVLAETLAAVKAVRRERADGRSAPPEPSPANAEETEMGGEAPCQLHRFWDAEE